MLSFAVSQTAKLGRIIGILVLIVNIVSYFFYTTNRNFWRENWREAVTFVENRARKDEIALFEFGEPLAPFKWYSRGTLSAEGALTKSFAEEDETKDRVANLVLDKKGIWYFEYLRDLSDPGKIVEKAVRELGFDEKEVYNFEGVGLIRHFSK